MSLNVELQRRYFLKVLGLCPLAFQLEDSNRMALVYFAMMGLVLSSPADDALAPLLKQHTRDELVEFVYRHLVPSGEGFRGSLTMKLENGYDPAHLPSTYFALCILLMLRHDYTKRLDRDKIMGYVARCQVLTGETRGYFKPMLDIHGQPFGDADLRFCQVAASIRCMLGRDVPGPGPDINTEALAGYIHLCLLYDGGIGGSPDGELHAGLTFCGVHTLRTIGRFDASAGWVRLLTAWLCARQLDGAADDTTGSGAYVSNPEADEEGHGGFNGRTNKLADTCYGFWVVATLRMVHPELLLIDTAALREYLLAGTQHPLMGGFGKTSGDFPDPLHSALGLACLSYLGEPGVGQMAPVLVIDQGSNEFLETILTD